MGFGRFYGVEKTQLGLDFLVGLGSSGSDCSVIELEERIRMK